MSDEPKREELYDFMVRQLAYFYTATFNTVDEETLKEILRKFTSYGVNDDV